MAGLAEPLGRICLADFGNYEEEEEEEEITSFQPHQAD